MKVIGGSKECIICLCSYQRRLKCIIFLTLWKQHHQLAQPSNIFLLLCSNNPEMVLIQYSFCFCYNTEIGFYLQNKRYKCFRRLTNWRTKNLLSEIQCFTVQCRLNISWISKTILIYLHEICHSLSKILMKYNFLESFDIQWSKFCQVL